MNATRTLTNSEIQQAIKEFVEREGWSVAGTPMVSHTESDGPMGGTAYSAAVTVEPPTRKRTKAE
jgi:hypothetical protein